MPKSLRRDEQGASAIEFALAAPAMLMFIIGIAQLGMLCMADAGLRSAVAEGARTASIYPTPDDDTILARIDEAAWGMQDEHVTEPTLDRDEDADGREYIEITMSYDAPLNFAFMSLEPVTLTEVRRVYTQGVPSSSSSSSSSTSSGASSTGGTSASSASSTGGTSATSASSTGGTSATSSTSSTSTGSSTSSGNASSGNNNGSSGHDHGDGHGNGSSGNASSSHGD